MQVSGVALDSKLTCQRHIKITSAKRAKDSVICKSSVLLQPDTKQDQNGVPASYHGVRTSNPIDCRLPPPRELNRITERWANRLISRFSLNQNKQHIPYSLLNKLFPNFDNVLQNLNRWYARNARFHSSIRTIAESIKKHQKTNLSYKSPSGTWKYTSRAQ